jgi:hypothetical protein
MLIPQMQLRIYSPRLRAHLIRPLYRASKELKIPMTQLASRFVAEGLNRLQPDQQRLAEEPVALDPCGRANKPDL